MADFTPAAANLLHDHKIPLDDYGGEATGADGQVLKADAEAWLESPEGVIRRTRRRCRGPFTDDAEVVATRIITGLSRDADGARQRADRLEELGQAEGAEERAEEIQALRDQADRLESRRDEAVEALKGETSVLAVMQRPGTDSGLLDKMARDGCGYPINDLILDHPMDGEPKEADCPGCGRTVRWTPEDFESE